jgi:hypothetical protein
MFDLNFKIKKLENVVFSYDDLLSYYEQVITDHQDLKWIPSNGVDKKTHNVSELYSWAIQSNLKDPTKPCPPYHIDSMEEISENNDCRVPTKLIFGFAKKIIETIPEVRQLGIAGHPPGTRIDLHPDNSEFLKIHIPIKTNPDAWFIFEDERFNLKTGHAYFVNTTLLHGTNNQGNTDRIHLIFKFPASIAEIILNSEYVL